MPAKKKDPSLRARRNKTSTRATLTRIDKPTTTLAAYSKLTVTQLREEIRRRNDDGRDEPLSLIGRKADLVQVLVDDDNDIPAMPDHPAGWWHAQTTAWWADVWVSPMAEQWDDSDVHNVFAVALLYNDIWTADTAKQRKDALAEYRLQRADLGLSPYSRRRLEWTIETAEEARDRGARRRGRGTQPAQPGEQPPGTDAATASGETPPAGRGAPVADPRAVLSLA